MRLTFIYPIYPTQEQETTLERWLDHLCDLQNSARHDRLVAYETEGAFVSLSDQQTLLTAAREKYDDFREVPQDFQNHALRRNDKAFTAFRKRCKENAEKKGYPRHKKRVRSLTWSLRKYTKVVCKKTKDPDKQTIRVRENPIIETDFRHNRLKVPKLGGETEDNPRWYRQAEGLLRKHSKDFSRKKKGSQRWQKQKHKLALHHERTTNKRKDFIGKLVYKLYHHQKNNVLVAENLNTSNMVKNKHLSKSISDASWSTFFEWCASIAERDGLHFHQVDPKNTSQTCSACGEKSQKKLSLAIRTFNCQFCGTSLDRDHNAALNILFRAACARRGERWVTDLTEARNTNEARDTGLQNAKQLLLFATSPSL